MRMIDSDEYKKKLYAMMPEFDEENDKKCIEGQTIFFCIATLDDMPTITPPPNDTLTLEELREMDGEPVWIEWGGHPQAGWALVRVWSKASNVVYLTYHNGNTDLLGFVLNDGGKIYRRKPEEGTT